MLTSITLAPDSTCCRATATASSYFSPRISLENFFEPVMFVRSPINRKLLSGRIVSGSRPLRRVSGSISGGLRGGSSATARGDGPNVRRRRAATAADDIQPAGRGEFAQRAGHHLGRFVELPKAFGKPALG